MLAVRTIAGDAFKDDVNDTNVIIEEFDDVLHVCGFVRWKSAVCITLGL